MNARRYDMPQDGFLLAGLAFGVAKAGFALSLNLPCPELLDTALNASMCGCFGIHVLLQRPGLKRLFLYALLAAVALVSARRSGDMNGMIHLLTCFALAGCSLDRVAGWLLRCNLVSFAGITGHALIRAALYGSMDNITMVYINGDILYHMGYIHKNILAMHLMSMGMLWLWGNWEKLRRSHLALALGGAAVLLVFSQCKTAFLMTLVLCAVLLYLRHRPRQAAPWLRAAAIAANPAVAVVTLVSMWLFLEGSPLAYGINSLLTGRIELGVLALQQYGHTLLGHPDWHIELVNGVRNFDNVYIHGLTNIGLIWPVAYCAAFTWLAHRSRDPRVHFGILAWAMYSMTEFPVTNGYFFFPAMLLSLLLCAPGRNQP